MLSHYRTRITFISDPFAFLWHLKNALRYSNECAANTIAPCRPELCTHSLACLALYDSSSFAPGRAKGHTLLDACLGSCRVILQGFFWTHITWKVTSWCGRVTFSQLSNHYTQSTSRRWRALRNHPEWPDALCCDVRQAGCRSLQQNKQFLLEWIRGRTVTQVWSRALDLTEDLWRSQAWRCQIWEPFESAKQIDRFTCQKSSTDGSFCLDRAWTASATSF